ncbi:pyridoxal phosphate-dependent aminotransferase [Oricola thermophila]|uniref:Pyridoxal phosphate-dependent aminotransferase n=1 Tax=Oricola thermophila TaxID=2742145 RepID=A0A6N1VH15_9HYPH|nr:pyridoxal phosphate-dependent aminotransferase [Oricola thermophila]QKV18582.1 pyridoxal phosphate-dependent aminotransferase [Oricola thermophila]
MPKANPLVASLPATTPFVGPERLERENGRPFRARLGANECNFGCSPGAIAAMDKAARDEVWKYCDPEIHELRAALARHLGVSADEIVVGAGIDNLLGLTVRIFSDSGGAIVTSAGAYPTFNYHVAGYGRRLVTVPYCDDKEDLDALASAANRENAKIVYLSNPDNPMGTWWSGAAIEAFMDALPAETLLILDEAYGELAPESALPAIDTGRGNVLRMRTFSKAYGLAGLRVGYLFGPAELCAEYHKVRDHFGVNTMAQHAAIAALADRQWLAQVTMQVEAARKHIAAIGTANGLHPLPSATNFVTLDCGRDGEHATRILNELNARGVFIRKPGGPGIDRCIRVSCGLPHELDHFEAMLPEALKAAG